jgi:site-specific DNA recombinase
MKAAIYARISTDRDGEEVGVDRQVRECRKLAKARGYEVADSHIFTDSNVSATKQARLSQRRGGRKLLAAIDAGEIRVVVSWANDRLARSAHGRLELMEKLRAKRAKVHTVRDGESDPNTASGRMTMGILGEVAQFEVERITERILSKHEELAANGFWNGGPRQFGFRAVKVDGGTSLEVAPAEAAAIREAAERLLNGESMKSVVRAWNAAGITTTGGRPWTMKTVRQVLLSPRIAGLRQHGVNRSGERVIVGKAAWEPILDKRNWKGLVDRLTDPARRTAGPGRRFLLTGLVVCGRCGRRLAGSPRGGRRYECIKDLRPGSCGRLTIQADPLDDLVRERAAARELADPVTVPDPTDVPRELREELTAVEERLAAWARNAAEAGLPPEEIREGREPLARRLAELEEEVARVRPPSRFSWIGEWAADPEGYDRAEIERVVERIVVKPVGKAGARWKPIADRVEITWREGTREREAE